MTQIFKEDDQRTGAEVLSDGSNEEYREASHLMLAAISNAFDEDPKEKLDLVKL